jgi:hypothetical protein
MKLREVYDKDPEQNRLLNQGVAKITTDLSAPELETLRFELTNFVCNGQYAAGLQRILSTYLEHLDQTEQPGVRVSGFYGSGKSHLVKMLQYVWTDFTFRDGATARGLAKLPHDITDLLTELSTQAKRLGGLHAIAGDLKYRGDKSVRLELLGLVFRSVGLPEEYARASFVLWLRHEGLEQAVREHVTSHGADVPFELRNLYVSDALANALLAVKPGFAESPAAVRELLQAQFPEKTDVTDTQLIEKIREALGRGGKLPCTLLVLDEVQQYIGDSVDRSKDVQDLQEQCCARLGANVLLVATGQNALGGTPLLQRLQGRFPVTVELQDTDVEQVTREVVLKKKPTAIPTVQRLLDTYSGEIERHLASTTVAFNNRDRDVLVHDYPLLPTRRRFWERALRAVDKAGTGAQLRTQLWIVYDAVRQTADAPVGQVVSAAFLYEHIKSKVLQSGVLLQEIAETIARQQHEAEGSLRYQLCALIFLIGQLPLGGMADAGIRADANTLSDLLVTDLTLSSAELRRRVSELLETLVASGAVMQVDSEYRLQTREGAEWNQKYLEAMHKLLDDPGKLGSERSQRLKEHCTAILTKFKLTHGASKEARRLDIHFGSELPTGGGSAVPVWIRDGWDVEERTVLAGARGAGESAATVYVFIPRAKAEELRQAIAGYYGATATLEAKGTPTTDEGIEAKKAMETRQQSRQQERDRLLVEILNDARVYLAGGDPVGGTLLIDKVQDAASACLDRLYPQFHLADSPDWHKVIERSRKGDGDALAAVGHQGNPEAHPVCAAVLSYVGSGKRGTEIRQNFANPRYGWPRDAVDASLFVLTAAGLLQARSGGTPVSREKLDQRTITSIEFRTETVTLSTVELIKIRGLFKEVGLTVQSGQESTNVPTFLTRMRSLAEHAGGAPPLLAAPSTVHLEDIGHRVGNDQLKAIVDQCEALKQQAAEWQQRAELIAKREPRWQDVKRLRDHAAGLPIAEEVRGEIDAIEKHRGLLADPDSVPVVAEKLTQTIREALNQVHARCAQLHGEGQKTLAASPTWTQLAPAQQHTIMSAHQLDDVPKIAVGSTEEVLKTLQAMKLAAWNDLRDALPTRFTQALQAAAKLLEPKTQPFKIPSATITTEDELTLWLTTTAKQIREKLQHGPVMLS